MSSCDKIVVIGAGNMATRLALSLQASGYRIVQVFSRTLQSAEELALRLGNGVTYTNHTDQIVTDAQLYIFSVSDNALSNLITQIPYNDALWIHTAGSVPADIFANKCNRYGVLYPMQTVNKDRETNWNEVPIFIEASNEDDTLLLENMAQSISERVMLCNSQQRQALHLAAVFACNFTNHMYAIAEKLLREQGLDFDVMKLLIRETEQKAEVMSPIKGQTGPAVRNDYNVMNKHISLLNDTAESELYRLISQNIIKYNTQNKHS